MGANATHSSNAISAEKNRKHLTVRTSSENINVLVQKDKNRHSKLPEESHLRTVSMFLSCPTEVM